MPDMTRLWSRRDIAEYLGVAYAAASYQINEYTFPRPIVLPNGRPSRRPGEAGKHHPRWKPADVVAWVDRYYAPPLPPNDSEIIFNKKEKQND